MKFDDKVVWVTGASSGIGLALCRELEQRGARLVVSARNEKTLLDFVSGCAYPERHKVIALDLTKPDSLESAADSAWLANGYIDVLFNNAGVSQRSMALDTSLEVDRRVMEVNYFGTIAITKAILPRLVARRQGVIVNIASIAGKIGSSMRSAYSGAKHALIGFMDCLRTEVAADGIRVVNVCPGFVKTNISRNALTGDMSNYDQMDEEIKNGMVVEDFVQILLKRLDSSNDELVIASGLPKLGYQMRRLFPNTYHRVLPKIYRRNK